MPKSIPYDPGEVRDDIQGGDHGTGGSRYDQPFPVRFGERKKPSGKRNKAHADDRKES